MGSNTPLLRRRLGRDSDGIPTILLTLFLASTTINVSHPDGRLDAAQSHALRTPDLLSECRRHKRDLVSNL